MVWSHKRREENNIRWRVMELEVEGRRPVGMQKRHEEVKHHRRYGRGQKIGVENQGRSIKVMMMIMIMIMIIIMMVMVMMMMMNNNNEDDDNNDDDYDNKYKKKEK